MKRGVYKMSTFEDKFHLSPEQSLFLAKKKWDENVYCGMKMENRAVTFPQTQTILNGVNVPNVQLDDIQAILNMRDAWKFLLSTVDDEVTFGYWCKLNEYIARNEALEWGKLRTGSVGISGTDYEPPVPDQEKTIKELANILSASDTSATDKALEAFTWGARGQFFWDGNKRTSLMLANKILVSSGSGIMTITDKYMEQFNALLLSYYNTGVSKELKQFLYENAIQGMTVTTI
jgi:Fic family protein